MCGSDETVTTGQHLDRRFNQPAGTNEQYDGTNGFKKNNNGKISMVKLGGEKKVSGRTQLNAPTLGTSPQVDAARKKTVLTGA